MEIPTCVAPLPGTAMANYEKMYAKSVEDPEGFWAEQAKTYLKWNVPFDTVFTGGFLEGDIAWFLNGKLNASACCIDQHLPARAEQTAIIWEGDEPGNVKHITYAQLHKMVRRPELTRARERLPPLERISDGAPVCAPQVCRVANALKASGVRKGDIVMIYMPMVRGVATARGACVFNSHPLRRRAQVPEIAVVMLACTRIGAAHSVVFAGFSADSLRDRIVDANSKWIVTSDEGKRGGRTLPLKKIVDDACVGASTVEKVFYFKRTNATVPLTPGRDIDMDELSAQQRPYCPCEMMDSEDLLFILYTSGSTGRPKGVAHTTAGYLLYAAMTTKHVFDLREGDVYACVADAGWITGHSYIVYGPLLNGTTTVMFESTPMYPDHGRYWDMVQRHKINVFYTAPTAIRALMRYGPEKVAEYDKSSLRVLGSVGEPINPEAWRWYFEYVGEKRCTIVDTWWQTETGGHMATPLPGVTPMKPGSCTKPFYGIQLAVIDPQSGKEKTETEAEGVLCIKHPWPSTTRTVYGDHERYLNVYMKPYPGYYFTGDGCRRDADGYYWITGRVDDVLNTSGHRIGTAEVESALVAHPSVSEAAVVGFPHDVKGEGIGAYVILTAGYEESPELEKELKTAVRGAIGPFATPDLVIIVPGLPKVSYARVRRARASR